MRVLLCGGGTAGHVMPAIAIAEIIEKSFPNVEIAFAGRTAGAENEAYKRIGHTVYTVDISSFSRSLSFKNVSAVFKLIRASISAMGIVKSFAPDVIIGTGGYVCYPFIRQGQRLGVKTVIHESNVAPGLVTRILGPRCNKVMLNLEGTREHLRKASNTVVVGNPTRKDFGTLTRSEARVRLGIPDGKPLIVSFGGSLGAKMLNEAVLGFIEESAAGGKTWHVHATGRNHYENEKAKHPRLFGNLKNVRIVPYIDDMPTVLKAADIAITRSGAMTVSELGACGTPSILIPSPNVTANHQYYNAKYMESCGAAVVVEETNLSPAKLKTEVKRLLESRDTIRKMSVCAKGTAKTDTDALIKSAVEEILGDKAR